MICDYNLHSEFSFDSSEKINAICEKAIREGISEIALTDHAEFPLRESAPWPEFEKRERVLEECRNRYGDRLTIRSGVEAGQPWRDRSLEQVLLGKPLDFVIASVHDLDGFDDPHTFPFNRDSLPDFIHAYLEQMTKMASSCDYDVIGHVTYLFRFVPEPLISEFPPESFSEWYEELFRVVMERGRGIEINCSGLRMQSIRQTLPSLSLLKLYRKLGGEIVTVGSDGHSCRSAFSGLEAGYEVLREAGFHYAASFAGREPSFYQI